MSGVRGPNSALTEFLRSQGIDATEIRLRHERRMRNGRAEDTITPESEAQAGIADAAAEQAREHDDPEVARIAAAAARKRRGRFDDLDENQAANEGTASCVSCNSRFTITVYSKAVPDEKDAFLCRSCSLKSVKEAKSKAKRGANKGAVNKKRKKLASELLNLKFLVPPSLQDLCIGQLAEYIDSVDELGELTLSSFNKISRILAKNRRLSPRTMQLFLRSDVTRLDFWDCSDLTPEAINLIPALCPNLTHLTLSMCGQLNDDNLIRIAGLKHLKELTIDGAFLVRKDAWLDFLDLKGAELTKLSIGSVYRVDSEVLALLTETCASLEHLTLHRLCQLNDPAPLFLLGNLSCLKHLELCDLEPGIWSDDAIIQTLNLIGSQLNVLILKGDSGKLSDRAVEAIAASCGNLHTLELVNLTSITEDAIVDMFLHWTEANSNTGLQRLSLERSFNVGDQGVLAALNHSSATLVDLNLNSLKQVTPRTIESLAKLPNLTRLDIGFVGNLDPKHIYKLSTSKTLKQVLAFGNIRLSGMPLPTGITVVGAM